MTRNNFWRRWEQTADWRVAGLLLKDPTMPTKTMADVARLNALLDEALALADALQMPLAAIHIDQALSQLSLDVVPA
jgi:hypothetical protein